MGWWAVIGWVASTVAGILLQPRARGEDVQPGSVSVDGIPTAEESRPIPVAFGTCWIRNPNVLWYGDVTAAAIYAAGQVIGHRYFATIHYGLCHGEIESLGGGEHVEVRFDDWRQPDPVTTADHGTHWQLQYNSPELFGGRETPGEGAFIGRVDVYKGGQAQTAPVYLTNLLGALPGYRGLAHAVFVWCELGNSPNLHPVSLVVKRLPRSLGLAAGSEDIAGDANPAAVLYEVLTDRLWGLGISSGAIDLANFRAVGEALKTEGLGVSMLFDQAAPARDLIEDVLRHIDGVIYADPETGLLTLRLARADYVFANLPILDESIVEECVIRRRVWEDTANLVRVRYNERVELTGGLSVERVATAQDLANIQLRNGEIVAEEIAYRGLTSAENAQRAAARELKTLAYPLATLELTCNRKAWAMRAGTVFRLQRPSQGIADLVCRVTRPRGGTLTDGRIRLEATEEIWGIGWKAYAAPLPPVWVPPIPATAGWGQIWGEVWDGAFVP